MTNIQNYEPLRGTWIIANIVYTLHTLSIFIGFISFGTSIAGAFVFSMPSVVAVVLNYIFRGDAAGSYLETHFAWQIRTFWYAVLALVLIWIMGGLLVFFGIGFFIWIYGYLVLGIWIVYRIVRGFLQLSKRESLPM